MKVPFYIVACAVFGVVWGIFDMWWVKYDAKKNPEKYEKEEDPRVKSFFDVI
tara:strand:+ start:347 stop:502 length:156 start_codon:yes stop_codon:yes gene_type:complete